MIKKDKKNNASESREESLVAHSFEDIWERWLKEENLEKKIMEHLEQRKKFLDFMKEILVNLKNDAKVLEIGAGTAIDSAYLAKEFPHLRFYGTDISQRSIDLGNKIIKAMGAKVELVLDDATKSKFDDEFFDLIFSQGVVEHFSDPSLIMREQVRILKNGGYLVIDVPQKYNPYTIYKHRAIKRGEWPYGWETEYSVWGLRKLGKQYGLKPLNHMGYGYGIGQDYNFHYLSIIGEKFKQKFPSLGILGKVYTKVFRFIEDKFGCYFMYCIVVSFRK